MVRAERRHRWEGQREADHTLPGPPPAPTSCAHWPDKGCQGLNANVPGLWDPGPGEAERTLCRLVASRLKVGSSGTRVPLSWSLQSQKAQDEGDAGPTRWGLWVRGPGPAAHWHPQPTQLPGSSCPIWKCHHEERVSDADLVPHCAKTFTCMTLLSSPGPVTPVRWIR